MEPGAAELRTFGAQGGIRLRRLTGEAESQTVWREPGPVNLLYRTQKWCPGHILRALCCPHLLPVSAQAGEVYHDGMGLEGSLFWDHLCFAPSELNLENSPFSTAFLQSYTALCGGG